MSDFGQVMTFWREGHRAPAEAALAELLDQDPDHLDGLRFLAELCNSQGRAAEELRALRRLAQLCPQDASVRRQLGAALLATRAYPEAIAALRAAIALDGANGRAHNNLGLALLRAGDAAAALSALSAAIAVDPHNAHAHLNRGLAQELGGAAAAAEESYRRALALEPHLVQAHLRLAALLEQSDPAAARLARWHAEESVAIGLMTAGRHAEARALLNRLLYARARLPYLEGLRFHCELWECDWSEYGARRASLEAQVQEGLPVERPFSYFVYSDSAAGQRRCAEAFVAERHPPRTPAPAIATPAASEPLTIAYLSPDFHRHATAYLIAGLLEAHDRERFRVIAASYGPDDPSPLRARLERSVDEFIDLRGSSDEEFVQVLRSRGVHIAVDLKGHAGGARTGVLASRAAPVQVNFLGYPGTLGAPYVDYIVADRQIIPEPDRCFYREQVVELPGCYQPNDRQRPHPAAGPGRQACGLPDEALVFCSFNHVYKIAPMMFETWLRLLRAVEGSVLWLLMGSHQARRNLRARAVAAGLAPERLVFAPHLELEPHLARYHHADLCLDTWPCNGHTTTSDALWMGVPVVTLTGRSFPSRVAGSLLHSLGLDELCTASAGDYEALALRLARSAPERARLRSRLGTAHATAELFDPQRYCRRLERAYLEMWSRHARGAPPAPIVVSDR
ncbi:MAG TPA: tetratricopeptide repeat protein [Steroidobacteraceae bacterium]|nr:tetratricopeptide repeat protein [Steroidobacteraceae bacterium]